MSKENEAVEADLGITFDDEVESAINDDAIEDSAPQSEDAPEVEKPEEQAEDAILEEEKPKEDGFQKRINKVTADKYEQQRRADGLQAELDSLKATNKPAPAKEPKLEDYDFDVEAHTMAMIDYKVDQKVNQKADSLTKQQQDNQVEKAKADTTRKFTENSAAFAEKNKDFNEVLGKVPVLQSSVLNELMEMENGPELAYFLGNHLDIADSIVNMNPVAAGIKIGEIARKLAEPKQVKQSNAPAPIEPLKSGGKAATDERGPVGAPFE